MRRFGAFEGVFTPTFLSILGVIMYLRLGWIVGEVGLVGTVAIILIANIITVCTGLSVASIVTNMRIGAGGAYSIISKSLGREAGGAIGIPLYLSQAISIAFYITGFTECWVSVFPGHPFFLVSIVTWLAILVVAYLSARLAFRLQYGIMLIIGLSLVSIVLSTSRAGAPQLDWQGLHGVSFWRAFAIFFPAVTGILAGVSMSGELEKPERNIPIGILAAIGSTFLIYLGLSVWIAHIASPDALVKNPTILMDLARWRFIVVAGIMGATLSSALTMAVTSPRTLFALGKHSIVPLSSSFARVTKRSEPSTAILFTALISLMALSLGTLNKIASLLTMFFLIAYGVLNLSVFIEKMLGIASFRPVFKVANVIPFIGWVGCLAIMALINQVFAVIALAAIVVIYIILLKRSARKGWPDVRRGLFAFIAERAVRISMGLPYHPKIWKPNLLVPIGEPKDWTGSVEFLRAITYPRGKLELFTILERPKGRADAKGRAGAKKKLEADLAAIAAPLGIDGMLVSSFVVEAHDVRDGAQVVMQTMRGSYLPPNAIFLKIGLETKNDPMIAALAEQTLACELGMMLLHLHPKAGMGQRRAINVWIREGSPNIDLALLVALQLGNNWEAPIRIIHVVHKRGEQAHARDYLDRLKKLARMPKDTATHVMVGTFEKVIREAPAADINIFGMAQTVDVNFMRSVSEGIGTSTLFLRDSKHESAVV